MKIEITKEELCKIRDLYARYQKLYTSDAWFLFLGSIIHLLKDKGVLDEG